MILKGIKSLDLMGATVKVTTCNNPLIMINIDIIFAHIVDALEKVVVPGWLLDDINLNYLSSVLNVGVPYSYEVWATPEDKDNICFNINVCVGHIIKDVIA